MKIHLVGGFLGSGKTTAIISAAKALIQQGLKIGVITNDQGKFLVDTNFFRLEDIPTVEVNGGCFCCNYTDFDESLDELAKKVNPDIVFAESVGTCADIVATVLQPLLEYKGSSPEDTSLSVFTDARILRAYINGDDLPFRDGVLYIFEKQIEESNILVVNKMDLLDETAVRELLEKAKQKFPTKLFLPLSSLSPESVQPWLTALSENPVYQAEKSLKINYQVYGVGEQDLAWYDGVYRLQGADAAKWADDFIHYLTSQIRQKNVPVGHLKFLLHAGDLHQKISFTSVFETQDETYIQDVDWGYELELVINARLECEQVLINQLVKAAFQYAGDLNNAEVSINAEEAFRPGFPAPTHRLAG